MLCSNLYRFLQIVGIFALTGFFSLVVAESASAQGIVSTTYNAPFLTATDSAGNTYLVNLLTVSPTSKNDVPGFFTPAGGTQMPTNFVTDPVGGGGGGFTINGVPSNQKLLSCSANATTTTLLFPPSGIPTTVTNYSATCYLTDTPRALLASIKQEVRSQSNEVIDMITDRLRALTQDLAESSAASVVTPPGGTVILDNFSSNPAPKYNGLSAGSDVTRWGLWANASGSYIGNNTLADDFNGTSIVALTGLDYIVDRQWIFGLSAGYSHADLTLSPSSITRQADGALIGPYAAYIFNPNWSLDGLVNWTSLSNNITAPLPFPAGGYHSNRVTGASNLNYFTTYNGIKLTGFGGYAYTWEGGPTNLVIPSALANNVRYGAIRIGGEAGYPLGAFEPYLPVRFEYETTTPNDGSSRAALVVGAGLRYRWSDSLTGGILFESTEFKTHISDMLLSAHLRWSF
jgi:hypothetical protein